MGICGSVYGAERFRPTDPKLLLSARHAPLAASNGVAKLRVPNARQFPSGVRTEERSMKPAGRRRSGIDVTVSGIGVHSGLPSRLTLHPAEANTGIVFLRSCRGGQPSAIEAKLPQGDHDRIRHRPRR